MIDPTLSWIIAGVIVLVIVYVLIARWAQREAYRVTTEVDFRVDSLNALIESALAYGNDDDELAQSLQRKSDRLRARANEVKSRRTPLV